MRTTRIEEAELLEAQLVEALAETRRAEGHAFEVVALAGLRERLAGEPAALAAVDEWLDADGAVLLADEIADLELDRRIDELVGLPDDAHEERVDGTFAIDELSAGLTFCGNQARIAPFIELLGRAIQATPAPWCALSPLASRILESAPPLDDDPAGGLWRTIESTPWLQDSLAPAGALPVVPGRTVGSPLSVQRLAWQAPRAAAQSASRLPSEHAEMTISLGEAADLTYARAEGRGELFLEVRQATERVTAQCDGRPVALTRLRPASWSCPAEPGLYVFHIDGNPHVVEVG